MNSRAGAQTGFTLPAWMHSSAFGEPGDSIPRLSLDPLRSGHFTLKVHSGSLKHGSPSKLREYVCGSAVAGSGLSWSIHCQGPERLSEFLQCRSFITRGC